MIIKPTKHISTYPKAEYERVYMIHKNRVYGHCINFNYGRIFISLYDITDFKSQMEEVRYSNDY